MLYCNWCMIKLVLILIFFIIINVFCYDWCIIKLILIDDGPMQKRCFFDYNLNPYQVIKNVTIELLKKKIMKKKKKRVMPLSLLHQTQRHNKLTAARAV